ncbi:hypothetical protein SD70_01720 [Gordoniibacillus kamchatkensis]|uniref:Reactive intermediate/imine deaminase n=1 Tax=Gordoniibacillus kamchatkensis TaxID=1590651 RepID=A0ABR5AMN4_9BACL|nr:RidA family protein [Paenibacillus sp. VKM B-2647]KIL42274.1 hypothetical protein SD70_01720 [Paenibacillus sp. VKM B-2647]
MKQIVLTDKAPKVIGPYSQAVGAGGFLFISGQLPIDPGSGKLQAGISEQTRQSLDNIQSILQENNMQMSDIVKTVIYIKDMNDFQAVNAVYEQYFINNYPARACVEVARLPMDALVEIEAIAHK